MISGSLPTCAPLSMLTCSIPILKCRVSADAPYLMRLYMTSDLETNILVLIPCLDRDAGKIFLDDRFDEQACLLDLGEQWNIMVNGVAAHRIVVIQLFSDVPFDDVDRQVNLTIGKVVQHIRRFLLMNFVEHRRFDALCAQELASPLRGVQRNAQCAE